METLPYRLDRTLTMRAPRETVFRFLTDPARWAAWWGEGSAIDARPGGRVVIRHPNGIEAGGEVLDVVVPARLVFTYGFASGTPMPIGASLVTITGDETATGTRLGLGHAFADPGARDEHVQGWRYQLALLANVVANEAQAESAARVDRWHRAWALADANARRTELAAITSPAIAFRDRFSAVEGLDDLLPHIAATHRFMPGLVLSRDGDVRHCQGVAVADWVARTAEGAERARGTNVYVFDAAGRIESVTGLWR